MEVPPSAALTDSEARKHILSNNGTYHLISKVAYLIGVPKSVFDKETAPPKIDTYIVFVKKKVKQKGSKKVSALSTDKI